MTDVDREKLFLSVAMSLRRLPNIRGKVRTLLAFHRSLGLERCHCIVQTMLHNPVSYRIRLDLHCKHERMALMMDGYEEDTVRFLCRLFDRSGYFLDVGANIGLISLPFAKMIEVESDFLHTALPQPFVYCLEPVRSNFKTLVHNIALNRLEKTVYGCCVAVGDCEKAVEIQVEGDLFEGGGTGTANILPRDSSFRCKRIPLRITTIDAMIFNRELPANCS